jgi:hypothetical protein
VLLMVLAPYAPTIVFLTVPFGVAFTAMAGVAWIRAGVPDPNRCERCNYDRTGLARGTPCPECGLIP